MSRLGNQQRGTAHIGIVTDGVEWRAYAVRGGQFVKVGAYTVKGSLGSRHAAGLVSWLRQLVVDRSKRVAASPMPLSPQDKA